MTTKTNARTQLLALLAAQGWELDPDERLYRGRWTPLDERTDADYVQNLHAFRRPAKHGGFWKVELDYTDRSSGYWGGDRTDNRLRKVELRHIAADGTEVRLFATGRHFNATERIAPAVLKNTDRNTWSFTSWLWRVTAGTTGTATLRQRAERLVTDPDLVIWLAAEAQAQDHQRFVEAEAARRADLEARRRPLPEGWAELRKAAHAIERADGKTDVAAVLADLRTALEAVEATVAVH